MGLFNRKPRVQNYGAPDLGMPAGEDREHDEGGPSPFMQELAQLRFIHQQNSIDVARVGYMPEAWENGRLVFECETALAHSHQELRDRLQILAQNTIQEETEDLYEAAGDVAVSQTDLERCDHEYLRIIELWQSGFEELEDEPQEVIRLNNLRSTPSQLLKMLILVIFVASEFIITGFIFNQALPLDIPFIGYVLAIGVMVMLIAVPHYLAQGIKEGITEHHRFDLEDERLATGTEGIRKRRQQHREERDDAGFKVISAVIGGVLLALILPLSYLRATETLTGNKIAWFSVFLFIQLAVSGYFFLREWLDHGAPSANLHRVERHLKESKKEREKAFLDYSDSLNEYFQVSSPVFKTMFDAVRLDAAIVENFYATLHFGRQLQCNQSPEYAAFITGARIPYLGGLDEVEDERGAIYDPVTSSNRPLESATLRSREWWLGKIDTAARHTDQSSSGVGVAGDEVVRPPSGMLIDSAAREWLYGYLDEQFGLGRYQAPLFEAAEPDGPEPERVFVG